MNYKLFAFDLDGTLLDDAKRISPANKQALCEMAAQGAVIAFATGRLGSSMQKYIPEALDDAAILILNGAEVYTGRRQCLTAEHSAPAASRDACPCILPLR